MALDEALLRTRPGRTVLRTYAWAPPALSLGYFQELDPEEIAAVLRPEYGLVRRPTGGRAIFHGDEVTYAIVSPTGDPLVPRDALGAYRVVHSLLIRALARIGCRADFRGESGLESEAAGPEDELFCFYNSTAFDLAKGGRKLVGSAQRRTRHGLLMHGSIPLGPNPLTPRAACAGSDRETFEAALAEEAEAGLSITLTPSEPTAKERTLALRLAETRYAADSWTFRRTSTRA
jgi:lipoate-protein ligase A